MALVTLNEVKTYLKITSSTDDVRLEALITYAQKLIESYCGRELEAASYTEYFDGGRPSVFVARVPINNVTSVSEYDGVDYVLLNGPNSDGSLYNTQSNTTTIQYTFYTETGEITKLVGDGTGVLNLDLAGFSVFNNFTKGVKIIYNGGYVNVPADLKLCLMDVVKMLHKDWQSQSLTFQGETVRQHDFSAMFPPHIRRILEMYRIVF